MARGMLDWWHFEAMLQLSPSWWRWWCLYPQEKPWQNLIKQILQCCTLQAWICRISCAWRYNALDWKPIIGFSPQKNNRPLGLPAGCGFVTSPDCDLPFRNETYETCAEISKKTSIKWVNVGNSWKHFLLAFCSVGFFHFGCFKHWWVLKNNPPQERWDAEVAYLNDKCFGAQQDMKPWSRKLFCWIIQKGLVSG